MCQQLLQVFLDKISKFDKRMGIANMGDQRLKGFHRRMQWRLAYKDDIKELSVKLGTHVGTITLLLMTQTFYSIAKSEHDRAEATCELKENIWPGRFLIGSTTSHKISTRNSGRSSRLSGPQIRSNFRTTSCSA